MIKRVKKKTIQQLIMKNSNGMKKGGRKFEVTFKNFFCSTKYDLSFF